MTRAIFNRQVIDAKAQMLILGGNLLHRVSAEEKI
jgi:hypothetical protein